MKVLLVDKIIIKMTSNNIWEIKKNKELLLITKNTEMSIS